MEGSRRDQIERVISGARTYSWVEKQSETKLREVENRA